MKRGISSMSCTYSTTSCRVGSALVKRTMRPWLWIPFMFKLSKIYPEFIQDLKTLHGYTEKVIADRKRELLNSNTADENGTTETAKKRRLQPFLDVLLSAQRNGADLSDRAIREEVDTFLFEGHDTTAMAICWALELLGRHPEVQEKLVEEMQGTGSDWESVSKLPYLDRVFKECLRIRPSVPFISRTLDSDVVFGDGKIIPATAIANIHIFDLHRNKDYFPDPERFDPDRFLPEKEQARHPFAYIPFSAGPRNCIGKRFAVMEVKLMLAAVVRRLEIRSAMPDDPEFVADLVLRPSTGVFLHLTPR